MMELANLSLPTKEVLMDQRTKTCRWIPMKTARCRFAKRRLRSILFFNTSSQSFAKRRRRKMKRNPTAVSKVLAMILMILTLMRPFQLTETRKVCLAKMTSKTTKSSVCMTLASKSLAQQTWESSCARRALHSCKCPHLLKCARQLNT